MTDLEAPNKANKNVRKQANKTVRNKEKEIVKLENIF